MRIAFDAHNIGLRETGNEVYTLGLLRALASKSGAHSFDVVTPYPSRVADRVPIPANFQLVRVWPAAAPLRIPFGMPLALQRRKPDLLHVTYVAPPLIGCKTVVTIHDLSFFAYPHFLPYRVRQMLRVLVPLSARRAAKVIAISEFTKQEIVRWLGVAPEKVAVTHLAAASAFAVLSDVRGRALPGHVRDPFILAVGNLEPRKNLGRLISAFDHLRRHHIFEGQLVLVGKAAWGSKAVELAVYEKGLSSSVVFTGFVTDAELNVLYNRASAFVYPSLYEGFGLPPIEAMAAGCPVVASSASALPEVLGHAAILVEPTSIGQIVAGIRAILERPELGNDLRQRGLAQAARYSWAQTAAQTISIYSSSLNGGRPNRLHTNRWEGTP